MKRIFFPAVLIATIVMGGVLGYAIWKATPVTSQQYFNSGKKYYDEKKYAEAIVQFLNAIQKDPQNREARYLLALSHLSQKDVISATKQLSALLEYFPDDIEANLRLGNIYLTAGPRDSRFFLQTAEIARKILSKAPENVPALILLGNATAGLQDYSSSVELFEKALTLDPQNSAGFVSLGTAQALQRNFAQAKSAFLKARELDPKDKSALIALANYYRAAANPKQAEAIWRSEERRVGKECRTRWARDGHNKKRGL